MTAPTPISPVDVSVVIATRNRCESLAETLRSIDRVAVPDGIRHEVIVVDNGSTDGTAALLAEAARADTQLVVASVPLPGKSRALNHALRTSRGRVLLFTDDDVRCPANWLAGMCEPILRGRADAVSGKVMLPPGHRAAMRGSLLETRTGWVAETTYIDFTDPKSIVGANMAIGRHVFDHLGGFDEDLGPGAPNTGLGEETLLCCRILNSGFTIVGVEDAAVEHHFDLSRIDDVATMAMGRKLARSGAYMNWHWYHRGGWIRPWAIPKLIATRWIRTHFGSGRAMSNEQRRVESLEFDSRLTYLREYRRLQRGPRKYEPSREAAAVAANADGGRSVAGSRSEAPRPLEPTR